MFFSVSIYGQLLKTSLRHLLSFLYVFKGLMFIWQLGVQYLKVGNNTKGNIGYNIKDGLVHCRNSKVEIVKLPNINTFACKVHGTSSTLWTVMSACTMYTHNVQCIQCVYSTFISSISWTVMSACTMYMPRILHLSMK